LPFGGAGAEFQIPRELPRASGRASFYPQSEVEFIMGIWQLEYFEAGASTAYMRETFYGVEAKNSAVALYARYGGDDVLKVTVPRKGTPIRLWLKKALQTGLLWSRLPWYSDRPARPGLLN
jgi:hypothetical protein